MSDPLADVRRAVARLLRSMSRSSGGGPTPGGTGTIPAGFVRVTILDDAQGNTRGVDRLFDALDATVADFPDVLRAVVPTIRQAHREVFRTEGAAGRGRWRPLAPATLRDRARQGYGPGPILKRTGELEAHVLSAPAKVTAGAGGVTLRIRPDDRVGGVPKYRALALGTSTIPARPMVALGPAASARVSSAIMRELRARAQARGLR